MSSAVTSCSSRPLSGVRVFLHIRHGPGDEDGGRRNHRGINTDYAMKRNGDGSRASARDVLRAARFHVQQLGATLALSEAAADLVVFHRGSASFLEAAHVKFKTVVRPDYLAACVAADQRVSIAPYVVRATAATCTTPARQSAGTSSSAVPASHTSAASPGGARRAATAAGGIPHRTGWGAKSSRSSRQGAAAAPSRATRSPPKCGAQTSAPAEGPTHPPLLRRLLLLDDDEDGGQADHQQQQQQRGLATLAWVVTASTEGAAAITAASPCCTPSAPRVAPSTPTSSGATKPHHLIADVPNSEASAVRCAPGQLQSDGAGGQQRRRAARAKRGVHQESTAAFELDEGIAQQPSTDTASTPRLTPSSRYEVGGCGSQGVSAVTLPSSSGNERVAAAVERCEADTEEEEAIRHAVLRSTATAAVTRRRGRPHKEAGSTPQAAYTVSLPAGSAAGDRSAMGKHSRDPFLNSEGSSQQLLPRAAPAPPPSELRDVSVAVTEPLAASSRTASIAAAQPQTPSAASAAPTRTTAKRPRRRSSSSSSVADSCAEGSAHHTRATPSDKPQGSRQRRRKQEDAGHGAVHEEASKSLKREQQQQQQRQLCARRRRRISGRGRAEVLSDLECAPAAELPLSMTFTDLAFLRRLAPEDEKVGVTAAGLCVLVLLDGLADVDAAAATLSSFLRDVVEQLGATCVVLGGGDDDDSGGCSSWFGRHKHTHAEGMRRMAKKPTHVVVGPHAVLTPHLLFCKALGIPIVTPQWLYDAVALGAFPAVLPHVHAHPVYGDRQVADAAVAVAAPVTAVGVPRRHELLGVEEDDGDAVEAKAVRAGAKAGTRCPPRCGRSSTLRQLRKEVAEEYVPAGEQARRPFYVPIFQDRMFYLHVPPVDLPNANAAGGGAGPLRSSRASRDGRSGNYLGDATAALAQVKELLRVLGGTVTRNVGSTYLDLVIDLTGFYDNMVKLGLTAREQQSQQQQARALRESFSCAFQDALRRVSLQPVSMDAGAASTASPTAPPVVGVAWLIHSILTRQWTATDPFALTGHPLTARMATAHPRAQVDGTVAASATMPYAHATGSGAVAAPVAEDALVAAGAPAALDAPYTHTPSTPLSHEEAADSPSSSVWSAVVAAAAAPHLKHARGPQAALKHASHQLGTQEIAAMLSDAQLQSVGVPDAATPSIPEPAHPPHQSAPTPFCMEEEDSLAFAPIQYSDGDYDGVV